MDSRQGVLLVRSTTATSSSSSLSSSSSSPSTSDPSFPILAISLLGILTTAILLVSYYLFVIKCCINWGRADILHRLTRIRSRRRLNGQFTVFAASAETRGLDESVIQAIPVFRFVKEAGYSFHECAVCLNEFQQDEKLRLLPGCCHAFHIDCIDIWLQTHANCPLCRAEISRATQNILSAVQNHMLNAQDAEQSPASVVIDIMDSPTEQIPVTMARHCGSSMGDECIDVRAKDDDFGKIQPIRRSFSMDSSGDRQLYLSLQAAVQRSRHLPELGEDCSSGSSSAKVRRSFFSFGHGRSSRSSSVLPVQFEM